MWCSDPVSLSSSIGTCNVHKTCLPVSVSYAPSTWDMQLKRFYEPLFFFDLPPYHDTIIECDSTLYVGMTQKQNGGPILPIHYSFAKYRLRTSIMSKTAFRSRSQLIIEIIKLLASGKNVVEVANRRKVKILDFLFFFST